MGTRIETGLRLTGDKLEWHRRRGHCRWGTKDVPPFMSTCSRHVCRTRKPETEGGDEDRGSAHSHIPTCLTYLPTYAWLRNHPQKTQKNIHRQPRIRAPAIEWRHPFPKRRRQDCASRHPPLAICSPSERRSPLLPPPHTDQEPTACILPAFRLQKSYAEVLGAQGRFG